MLWMETYFLYCSVRLGVMVISVLSFISLFVPSIIFFVMGLAVLKPTLELFNDVENLSVHPLIRTVTDNVENDSNNLKVLVHLYLFAHMAASILAFYGSLKLKRHCLLPMIIFEFCRVICCLTLHILLMIGAKSRINLGILITITLAGGFVILLLGYNWATCVALYQIINLINSERYKSLYGDDPFKPLIPKTISIMETENVRVLITPTTNDIDEQKNRNALLKVAHKNHLPQAQAIISVLPINYFENNRNSYRNNLKWKESHWPTTTLRTPLTDERYPASPDSRNDTYEANYNNWQWSELAPAVSFTYKNNIYFGSKRI